ncbi:MAG: hypothetical protein KDK48_04550, partial [Chlamydiia bacterium]|nr:hypothetical protein [Chlamydiia bacterium]
MVLTTLLFTAGGTYYAFFYTPKYRTTALLSSQIFGSLTAVAVSTDRGLPLDDKETAAPRQLELIKTHKVLAKVIDRLRLNTSINVCNGLCTSDELIISSLSAPRRLLQNPFKIKVLDKETYELEIAESDEAF